MGQTGLFLPTGSQDSQGIHPMIRFPDWHRKLTLLGVVLFSASLMGCGGSGSDRLPIKGKVTYNGTPVDNGVITFIPDGGDGGQRVKTGGPIVNGEYALEPGRGPSVGKYKVEIIWNRKTGKKIPGNDPPNMIEETVQVLPPEFNTKTTLTADVKSASEPIDFALTGKKIP